MFRIISYNHCIRPVKKHDPASGRTTLPSDLRREVIVIQPEEDVTGCTIIGEEITEVFELIPAEYYIKRYVRPKYAPAVTVAR